MRIFWDENCWTDDHKPPVIGEEWTLTVQLLIAGGHRDSIQKFKKSVEYAVSDPEQEMFYYLIRCNCSSNWEETREAETKFETQRIKKNLNTFR